MKRAIIWTAVSSPRQVDKVSLTEQEKMARAFCEANHLLVVDVLSVRGHSRSESDIFTLFEDYAAIGIDAYQRLRDHWRANDFDVLVAFHHSRLGRSFSISAFILENVVKAGRRLYLLEGGGWVDETNVDGVIAVSGFATKSETRQRLKMTAQSIHNRMRRGLNTRQMPFSHRAVRDERGKVIRLEVHEGRRALFEAAADLLLARVGWNQMTLRLYESGFQNPNTGKPIGVSLLYSLFHGPYTWGYAAVGYMGRCGLWVFDEGLPMPDGAAIERSPEIPIPPVWTGERAEQIKAELFRRGEVVKGRAAPNTKYALSGLLYCAKCKRRLAVTWFKRRNGTRSIYWTCPRLKHLSRAPCDHRRLIRDDVAKAQIEAFIRRAARLKYKDPLQLAQPDDKPNRRALLEQEIATIERRLDALILQRADAPDAAQAAYQRRITDTAAQLEAIQREYARLEPPARALEREKGLAAVLAQVDRLWTLQPGEANALLHRAFRGIQFLVYNGEIVSIGSRSSL